MFDGKPTPKRQQTLATIPPIVALFSLVTLSCSPVNAATNASIPCNESTAPSLQVTVQELVSRNLNHRVSMSIIRTEDAGRESKAASTINVLVPRAEAAIRDAFGEAKNDKISLSNEAPLKSNDSSFTSPFAGSSSKTTEPQKKTRSIDAKPGMNTKLPGISDDDLSRFKKQMYRRDI